MRPSARRSDALDQRQRDQALGGSAPGLVELEHRAAEDAALGLDLRLVLLMPFYGYSLSRWTRGIIFLFLGAPSNKSLHSAVNLNMD